MSKYITDKEILENYNYWLEGQGEIFRDDPDFTEEELRYSFLFQSILNNPLITYDYQLDCDFGRVAHKVMKAILKRERGEYIYEDNPNFNYQKYKDYIMVATWFEERDWIEWGTSIRSCWFEYTFNAKFFWDEEYKLSQRLMFWLVDWLEHKEKPFLSYEDEYLDKGLIQYGSIWREIN